MPPVGDQVTEQHLTRPGRGTRHDQPAHARAGGGELAGSRQVGAPLRGLAYHDERGPGRVGDVPQLTFPEPGNREHRRRADAREGENDDDQPRLVRQLHEHAVPWPDAKAAEEPAAPLTWRARSSPVRLPPAQETAAAAGFSQRPST